MKKLDISPNHTLNTLNLIKDYGEKLADEIEGGSKIKDRYQAMGMRALLCIVYKLIEKEKNKK